MKAAIHRLSVKYLGLGVVASCKPWADGYSPFYIEKIARWDRVTELARGYTLWFLEIWPLCFQLRIFGRRVDESRNSI